MRVFVDTNGWLRCAAWRIDISREAQRLVPGKLELVIVEATRHEIDGLLAAGGTLAREAKVAQLLLSHLNVGVIKAPGRNADEQILNTVHEADFVLTQDQALKRLLKERDVGIIVIRGQSHLELENKS